MAIFKFVMGNMRRSKSYSVVICVLVFLTGLILCVTTSTMKNSSEAFDQAYSRIGGPHLLYSILEENYSEELRQWFEQREDVEAVKLREAYLLNGALLQKDNRIIKSTFDYSVLVYSAEDKMRLIDSLYTPETALSKGEIYLPYIYETTENVVVGDKIEYVFDDQKLNLKVVGFIEEPIAGGELNSEKYIFLSRADVEELLKLGGDNIRPYVQMRVRLTTEDEAVAYQVAKEFMKNYGSDIRYVKMLSGIKNNLLMLPNIAMNVMIVFAILLCAITITIMRYAIMATIEKDYTNIGIVKALGFTPFMVQISITGHYALLAFLSGMVSLIAGMFVTPLIGQIILGSSGLFLEGRLSLGQGFLTLFSLVFVISMFSFITARHSKKISPIRAITNGIAPVYFSSRINLGLEKMKWLSFNNSMVLKQVLTKSKRYILLIAISGILAYVLSFSFGLVDTFKGEEALGMMGAEFSDVELDTDTKAEADKIISSMKMDYEVQWLFFRNKRQLEVDDERTAVDVRDNFTASGVLITLEGYFPKHDNEVAITSLLERRYQKHVGDYLSIKDMKGELHEFIITGTFQTIDEGGAVIMMHVSGMKLLDTGFEQNEVYIKLVSHDNLDETISQMEARYTGFKEISNERKGMVDQINTMKNVFVTISNLFFVLTIIMISVITLLMMKITIFGETRELGIYKAIGFSSSRLRLQLAQRFVIITVLGGSIGIILETLFGAKLFSYVLRYAGISSFYVEFNLANTLLPIVIISLLALISSYISSTNTKRVSAYGLINE